MLQFATAVTAMKRVPHVQNWCRSRAWENMRSVWAGLAFGGVTVTVSKCDVCAIFYYPVQNNMFGFTLFILPMMQICMVGGSCHKYHFCCNKHVFVMTKHVFCRGKSMLVATKLLL